MVWSKASHLMSRKLAFCGMICNLLCKSEKTIVEKSRFKALKTCIFNFFGCTNLLRIQNRPFWPKQFALWFLIWHPLGAVCPVISRVSLFFRLCLPDIRLIKFEMKMSVLGIIESPILGPSGNKEFLMVAKKV